MNTFFKTMVLAASAAVMLSCASESALTLSGLDPERFDAKAGRSRLLSTLCPMIPEWKCALPITVEELSQLWFRTVTEI